MLATVLTCGLDLLGALSDRPARIVATSLYVLGALIGCVAVSLVVRERRAA
jgi:hypothetical protein